MSRIRPNWHFTPTHGWMNDPHGVYFDGQQYHLFFQYVADSLKWEPTIAWGHAVSPDLITWTQVANAIEPLASEAGCWSGSVVVHDGTPHLFYTSPDMADWKNGSVVHALPDSAQSNWTRTATNPLITRPTNLGITDFRDPQIRKTETGWKLLMAAGLESGVGGMVEYESSDLLQWDLRGLIADSNSALPEPSPQSTVWECPQLFELDDKWVLIISAMNADGHIGVRYALGDYDGDRFTAEYWGKFCHTGQLYASSLFYDAAGKPNLISWFKEIGDVAPADSTWTSAQSLPMELRVIDGKLRALPRSDFYFAPISPTESLTSDESNAVRIADTAWRLDVVGPTPWSIVCTDGRLRIHSKNPQSFDVNNSAVFYIVIDGDICEIFADDIEGVIAFRCPANGVMVLNFYDL